MTHPADCPTCACDPQPMPYAEARGYADAAVRVGLPTGARTVAALLTELDGRDAAYVKLGTANAANLVEIERHTAAARVATRELGELNDRVGALTDELAEAQHDRQVLATENGAMRDELDLLRGELDQARRELATIDTARRGVEREAAELRRKLDARDMADVERARAAALDSMPDGGV